MKLLFAGLLGAAAMSAQVRPVVIHRSLTEHVNVVRLAPRYSTAIRMPEAVRSVVVGDPGKFLAEHSDREPALVLVKPVVEETAESNLFVTTVRGRQVSLLLRSDGAGSRPVDFLVNFRSTATFLVDETTESAAVEVPGTQTLSPPPVAAPSVQPDGLDQWMQRQQRATVPLMYGERAPEGKGDRIKTGISEVLDRGREVIVLFSVVNPQSTAIEILPPQVQLAGRVTKGFPIRRSRWGTSEQLPVKAYRVSRRKLGPGERADGVVVFDRPGFKQSSETLFLQIAESGAVDRTALAPIGFGVSAHGKGGSHGE
ncbi:MAG: hypothetical protein IPJ98_00630 [Bryobacterales bacterium]|nr:hypothetical protein [Bryobacterales bacterium]